MREGMKDGSKEERRNGKMVCFLERFGVGSIIIRNITTLAQYYSIERILEQILSSSTFESFSKSFSAAIMQETPKEGNVLIHMRNSYRLQL